MQVSNISHVNSFDAILRCWFLTFTNMLVLTKQQGSSACNLDVHVVLMWECLGMRYRKDMHVWKSSK
jgi:hypothetical protein